MAINPPLDELTLAILAACRIDSSRCVAMRYEHTVGDVPRLTVTNIVIPKEHDVDNITETTTTYRLEEEPPCRDDPAATLNQPHPPTGPA